MNETTNEQEVLLLRRKLDPDESVIPVARALEQDPAAEDDAVARRREAREVGGHGHVLPAVLLAGLPARLPRHLGAPREARRPLDAEQVVVPLGEP